MFHVGSAADLSGEIADGVGLDPFAVLAFEDAEEASFRCFRHGHLFHDYRQVLSDDFVHQVFHLFLFFLRHRTGTGEVEPQPFCCNVGTLLFDVFLRQDLLERCLEQVGGGVELDSLFLVVRQACRELPFRTGFALALVFREGLFVTFLIDLQASFCGQFFRDLYRESIGII